MEALYIHVYQNANCGTLHYCRIGYGDVSSDEQHSYPELLGGYWCSCGEGESTLITVQGNNNYTQLHMQDKITWYIKESGDRYEGTVLNIDSSTDADRLDIEVTASDWTRAKKESDTESAEPPVYVELPQGQKTVFAKLFKKGAVE